MHNSLWKGENCICNIHGLYIYIYIYIYIERERERERETQTEKERERGRGAYINQCIIQNVYLIKIIRNIFVKQFYFRDKMHLLYTNHYNIPIIMAQLCKSHVTIVYTNPATDAL